jgi:hypothetical protein
MLLSKIRLINNNKRILIPFVAVIFAYICLLWGFQLVFNEMSSVSYYGAFRKMASYPENTVLFMNMKKSEGTVELVYETQIQLSEFWNRNDLKVSYLDLQNLPQSSYLIVDSDQFPRAYTLDELNSVFKNKPTIIKNVTRGLVITTPLELIKQSVKKLANLLINKKQFTSDGLYTYYYNFNNWYFYYE